MSKLTTYIHNLTTFLKLHPFFSKMSIQLSFVKYHYLTEESTQSENKQIRNRCITTRIEHIDDETASNGKECSGRLYSCILELNTEDHEVAPYYIENGLRKVHPYYFTYKAFAKNRWLGQKLLDLLKNEFQAVSPEEYMWRFQSGAVTVNNEKVEMDYIVKSQDFIQNIVHRHEAPVINQAIPIVHIDKDILVVSKPASIPVHPNGAYRYNTVLFLLAKEYNLKHLRTVHRLDRLASGLLIFGRTKEMTQTLAYQIYNRQVQKQYICRVVGEFPDNVIECSEPIEALDSRIAVGKVSANGKPSLTIFHKLSYNGKSSVVLCKPTTGRMHQIRIHLQFLGYPILNDTLYSQNIADMDNINELTLESYSGQNLSTASSQKSDEHCFNCKVPASEPNLPQLSIYLHAWKYQGKGWSYATRLPHWAHQNWSNE